METIKNIESDVIAFDGLPSDLNSSLCMESAPVVRVSPKYTNPKDSSVLDKSEYTVFD